MENAALVSLLRPTAGEKRSKSAASGFLRILKLFPALASPCKMVALLSGGGPRRRPLLADKATTGTLFGPRKGRVTLAIQDDPHSPPTFVAELPLPTAAFHKEMAATDTVRIALESETRTAKRRVTEEFVWAVFCNGRKVGYSIRRRQLSDDESYVMRVLRGVSMGAGVLPPPEKEGEKKAKAAEGELTYLRARFERVAGSKDSETLYMMSPDGAGAGPELSIFFLRTR